MPPSELEERIVARVRDWFRRSAPIVRDRNEPAWFEITLHNPGGDDDGTLYLEVDTCERQRGEMLEGRVDGVKFRESEP